MRANRLPSQVAIANEFHAPAIAAGVADIVKGLVPFLKITVAPSVVEVREEKEGKRGVSNYKASAGQIRARRNGVSKINLRPAQTAEIWRLTRAPSLLGIARGGIRTSVVEL
jgi:hypothetical protein